MMSTETITAGRPGSASRRRRSSAQSVPTRRCVRRSSAAAYDKEGQGNRYSTGASKQWREKLMSGATARKG